MLGAAGAGGSPSSSAAAASAAAEHANQLAELELLAQNQRKLGQLTQRMTSILNGFDRRLVKLENSILPIHRSTQSLLRVESNIDATLATLNKTLGHYDVVQDEEPLIQRGPSARDPSPYMATIERVLGGLEYVRQSNLQSQAGVVLRMHDLIELGSRKLTALLRDWVEADTDVVDVDALGAVASQPATHRPGVLRLLAFLQKLPAHPSTQYQPLAAALKAYAEVRAKHLVARTEHLGQRAQQSAYTSLVEAGAATASALADGTMGRDTTSAVAAAVAAGVGGVGGASTTLALWDEEGGGYQRGRAGIAEWCGAVLDLFEVESRALSALVQDLGPKAPFQATFAELLRPSLASFSSTCSSLHTIAHPAIAASMSAGVAAAPPPSLAHTCFCLDVVAGLGSVGARWEATVVGATGKASRGFDGDAAGFQALDQHLHALRSTAMQALPAFLRDVNALPVKREGEVPSTTVNEISHAGVAFMRHMAEYADVVTPLLHSMGAGAWLPGGHGSRRAPPTLSLPWANGGEEDATMLASYLCDVLAAVLDALEARSRSIRQPSTASIFLLNNLAYLRRELDAQLPSPYSDAPPYQQHHHHQQPTHAGTLARALGDVGEELLRGAVDAAVVAYLEAWGAVVAAVSDDATSATRAERAAVKDRFAKFYEGLDDIERLHRAYPLLRGDSRLKDRLRGEVVRLVCPPYARFVAKHRNGDFSKNPSKHIRMTEQEVEDRLRGLYG